MRCAVHPNQEAVGICKACGAAVCPRCRNVIGGITYCNNCALFRGWLALRLRGEPPPPGLTPQETRLSPLKSLPPLEPADAVTRRLYRIGIVGLILFGVSLHMVWAFGLFWAFSPSLWQLDYQGTGILLTVGFGLLATGMALSGFAFLGLQRHFDIGQGFAAAASSFLFAWWPISADLLKYTGLVLSASLLAPAPFMLPGPLYSAYATLQAFGCIMIIVTVILWARAVFAVRRPSGQHSVVLNAYVLIMIAVQFSILLVPIDFASRAIYPLFFPPTEFFMFLLLAFILQPAALLIALLLHRVRRGIVEKPSERPQRQRLVGTSAGEPLQWIHR